ncbi:hypothetical protein SEA_SAMISTI12_121 [Streptomyces phage Samisti12]|uniref:Uncharacterized protein n=1 Tax=Streptomyces phage Samisti12 TaxID=2023995 RepID=A0A223G005_9CAUD|nr:hypothetical protein FDI39_gp152 [Streptomyces phage Samisti12]AST15342.1 hypothetical protein SEA_SAMISTI12_121 [Streptomyces phage Samisti12]
MPKYEIKGTIPFGKDTEIVDDVYEAKNELEANRKFNARVQEISRQTGRKTTGKPNVTITLKR